MWAAGLLTVNPLCVCVAVNRNTVPPGVCNGAISLHALYVVGVTVSADGVHLSVQHNHGEGASLLLHFSQALPAVVEGVEPADVVERDMAFRP